MHGDLKPENILLTLDSPPVIKVTDPGITHFLDPDAVTRVRPLTNFSLIEPSDHLPRRCVAFQPTLRQKSLLGEDVDCP